MKQDKNINASNWAKAATREFLNGDPKKVAKAIEVVVKSDIKKGCKSFTMCEMVDMIASNCGGDKRSRLNTLVRELNEINKNSAGEPEIFHEQINSAIAKLAANPCGVEVYVENIFDGCDENQAIEIINLIDEASPSETDDNDVDAVYNDIHYRIASGVGGRESGLSDISKYVTKAKGKNAPKVKWLTCPKFVNFLTKEEQENFFDKVDLLEACELKPSRLVESMKRKLDKDTLIQAQNFFTVKASNELPFEMFSKLVNPALVDIDELADMTMGGRLGKDPETASDRRSVIEFLCNYYSLEVTGKVRKSSGAELKQAFDDATEVLRVIEFESALLDRKHNLDPITEKVTETLLNGIEMTCQNKNKVAKYYRDMNFLYFWLAGEVEFIVDHIESPALAVKFLKLTEQYQDVRDAVESLRNMGKLKAAALDALTDPQLSKTGNIDVVIRSKFIPTDDIYAYMLKSNNLTKTGEADDVFKAKMRVFEGLQKRNNVKFSQKFEDLLIAATAGIKGGIDAAFAYSIHNTCFWPFYNVRFSDVCANSLFVDDKDDKNEILNNLFEARNIACNVALNFRRERDEYLKVESNNFSALRTIALFDERIKTEATKFLSNAKSAGMAQLNMAELNDVVMNMKALKFVPEKVAEIAPCLTLETKEHAFLDACDALVKEVNEGRFVTIGDKYMICFGAAADALLTAMIKDVDFNNLNDASIAKIGERMNSLSTFWRYTNMIGILSANSNNIDRNIASKLLRASFGSKDIDQKGNGIAKSTIKAVDEKAENESKPSEPNLDDLMGEIEK